MSSKVADVKSRENGRFDPELRDADQGFFLTKLLNADAMKDFVKGASERATSNESISLAGDIANLPQELNPLDNLEAFREAVRRNGEMSLAGIIFGKLLLPDLMKAGFAAATTSGLGAVTPLFTKQIIGYVDTPNPTAQEQSSAYGFGGAWVGTHGAKIFSKEYVGKVMFQQALKAQQILNVEIIRKITRLKPQIRKVYQNGDELKILTGHVSNTFSFIRACSIFIASPTKLIAVQVLVYNEIGYLGLVLIGVISIVAVAQVLISRRLAIANKIKRKAGVQRSEFNLSSFASIKHIRQLGWEDYIMKKNKEIREVENQANQNFYTLQSVSSTLANMAPTVIILIILLVQALTTYQADFTIAKIYTVLAYVGMSYSPAKSFFEVIFLAIEGFAALKKIDVLLKLPETEEVDQMDKQLQPGEVLARRGYLGSFEEDHERLAQMPDKEIQKANSTQINVFNPRGNVRVQQEQLSELFSIEKYKIKVASLTLLETLFIRPGDRYTILGRISKDRRAFLYAIMGKLITVEGKIRYGGKFGYIPDAPWLKKDTVKENILFGLEDDPVKLKKIYEVTMLNEEIKKLPKQEQTVVLEDASNLTSIQIMSIVIARTLYMEPDIILFENTFDWFKDEKTASSIFDSICKEYPNITIIQATHPFTTSQLAISDSNTASRDSYKPRQVRRMLYVDQSKDKKDHNFVILIEEGIVKQTELFYKAEEDTQCAIHKFLHIDALEKKTSKVNSNLQNIRLMMQPDEHVPTETDEVDLYQDDEEIDWMQVEQRAKRNEELSYKASKFVTYLLKYTEGMSKDEIAEKLLNEANARKKPTDSKLKRIKGVPFAVYVTLFRSVGYTPYFLLSNHQDQLVLLLVFAEAVKIFSDWWLGTIQNLPWHIPEADAVYIFIGLSMGFSLLSLTIGLTGPKISRNSAEAISKKVCNTLAKSRLSWFEGKNVSDIANRINLNTEEIFRLNIIARNLIRNILLFLATMVLVGINNPSYAAIAVGITIVAIIIMYFYIQQERETVDLGRQFKEPVEKAYEHAIRGTEAMKAVNQLDSYRDEVVMPIYRMQAHASYDKNINHGMAILTKLTSMIGVTGTAFLSVGSNTPTSSFEGDPAIAGTSITFTQKLNEIMVNISRDFKSLELGLRESVVKAYFALENAQIDRNGDPPPPDWPINNTVRFVNITIEEPDHSLPALINQSFVFPSGKKSMICGMRGGRAILMAISRQLQPETGKIEIGGVDIKTIRPSELAKKVMMLDEEPFFFNGTIKENLAPKDQTRVPGETEAETRKKERAYDNQLKMLLKMVGIWDSLPTESSQPKRLHDVSESGEGSFAALSFYDEDSKSRMAKRDREEEDIQTDSKLRYVITDVKKQLSCGIRQRLNIVRALLLKPKVLLCHNHLSYLRDKTAADLNRLLMAQLKDTTIIYYVPKPDTKKPMIGINRVFYSRRGAIYDMGGIKTEDNPAKIYYYPFTKNVQPLKQSTQKTARSAFASMLKAANVSLYDQLKKHLREPAEGNIEGTIWDRVQKMIEEEYNSVFNDDDAYSRRPITARQQFPDQAPRRTPNSEQRNQKAEKKDASSQLNAEMPFEEPPGMLNKNRTSTAQPFPKKQ